MSVGSNRLRKARKPHTCEECRRTIPRGATYHHVTGLFDGAWWSADICARCERAWDRAHDRGAMVGHSHDDPVATFGELASWLWEWRARRIDGVRERRKWRRTREAQRRPVAV